MIIPHPCEAVKQKKVKISCFYFLDYFNIVMYHHIVSFYYYT